MRILLFAASAICLCVTAPVRHNSARWWGRWWGHANRIALCPRCQPPSLAGTATAAAEPGSRRVRGQSVGNCATGSEGRRRDMGLGSYPAVTLARPRTGGRCPEAHRERRDPIDARRRQGRADEGDPDLRAGRPGGDRRRPGEIPQPKVRYQWSGTSGRPSAATPLTAGERDHHVEVAKVLKPIWTAKPEVARKLLPAIRRVFEHARVVLRDEHGIAMRENPASWADLRGSGSPPKSHSRGKHPHFAYSELPSFMAATSEAVGGCGPRPGVPDPHERTGPGRFSPLNGPSSISRTRSG